MRLFAVLVGVLLLAGCGSSGAPSSDLPGAGASPAKQLQAVASKVKFDLVQPQKLPPGVRLRSVAVIPSKIGHGLQATLFYGPVSVIESGDPISTQGATKKLQLANGPATLVQAKDPSGFGVTMLKRKVAGTYVVVQETTPPKAKPALDLAQLEALALSIQ